MELSFQLDSLVLILVGLLPLFFGRRLFWLFVGVAGFLFGFTLAQAALADQPVLTQLLLGLLVGIACAVLARLFVKPMAIVGAFLALAGVGVGIGTMLAAPGWMSWLLWLVFGLIGALLVALYYDWALILASAGNGAAAVIAGLAGFLVLAGWMRLALLIVVFLLGVLYQARDLRESQGAPALV
jgi:hypothetical protein